MARSSQLFGWAVLLLCFTLAHGTDDDIACASDAEADDEGALLQLRVAVEVNRTNTSRLDQSALTAHTAHRTNATRLDQSALTAALLSQPALTTVKTLLWALPVPATCLLVVLAFACVGFLWPARTHGASFKLTATQKPVGPGTSWSGSRASSTGLASLGHELTHNGPLEPPNVLVFAVMVAEFLMNANLTVAIPTSQHAVANSMKTVGFQDHLSRTIVHSGGMLGVYGIGALLAVFPFLLTTRISIRGCFLAQCVCLVVGNSVFIGASSSLGREMLRSWAETVLLLGRLLAGFEAGANYTCYMSLTHFTDYSVRAKYFALLNIGTGAGLVSGPLISSLAQFVNIGMSPSVQGSVWILALGLLFFAFLVVAFPGQSELFALANLDVEEAMRKAQGNYRSTCGTPHDSTPTKERRAWMACITGLVITFLRIYFRLAWESGAAIVIAFQFYGNSDAGIRTTGLWIAAPLCLYVPGQMFFSRVTQGMSIESLSRWVLLFEVLGVLGMFSFWSVPDNAIGSVSWLAAMLVFACGSSVFYCANQFNAAVFTTWMTQFDLASHPVLNKEIIIGLSMCMITTGYILGPSLVRLMLANTLSQSCLASYLLIGVLLQGVCSEVGVHFAEHGEGGEAVS